MGQLYSKYRIKYELWPHGNLIEPPKYDVRQANVLLRCQYAQRVHTEA